MNTDLKLIAINFPYTLRGPREGRLLYHRAPAVARILRTWHNTLALVVVSVTGAGAGCESQQPLPEAPPYRCLGTGGTISGNGGQRIGPTRFD
jgi:hypothetical protein